MAPINLSAICFYYSRLLQAYTSWVKTAKLLIFTPRGLPTTVFFWKLIKLNSGKSQIPPYNTFFSAIFYFLGAIINTLFSWDICSGHRQLFMQFFFEFWLFSLILTLYPIKIQFKLASRIYKHLKKSCIILILTHFHPPSICSIKCKKNTPCSHLQKGRDIYLLLSCQEN